MTFNPKDDENNDPHIYHKVIHVGNTPADPSL